MRLIRDAASQLAAGDPALLDRVRTCRRLLHRRALTAAAAGAVPVPGFDWAVDAALLSKLLPEINAQFGLTPDQMAQLPRHKREQVQKALATVGSLVAGRIVTRELVLRLARTLGLRMSVRQAAKYVPFAGQAVSALMGYSAVRYLGEAHIRDCVEVALAARLQLPAPPIALAVRVS